jgi:hypothetical protein
MLTLCNTSFENPRSKPGFRIPKCCKNSPKRQFRAFVPGKHPANQSLGMATIVESSLTYKIIRCKKDILFIN